MKHILFDRGHLENIKKQLKIKNSIKEIVNTRKNINNVVSLLKEIKMYICCAWNWQSGKTSMKWKDQ